LLARPRLPDPVAEAILAVATRPERVHADAAVRLRLVEHPDVSRSVLDRLRSDPRSDVGVRAGRRLSKM
jgi:hypothetical protein